MFHKTYRENAIAALGKDALTPKHFFKIQIIPYSNRILKKCFGVSASLPNAAIAFSL
jgi:hypothetical protein